MTSLDPFQYRMKPGVDDAYTSKDTADSILTKEADRHMPVLSPVITHSLAPTTRHSIRSYFIIALDASPA